MSASNYHRSKQILQALVQGVDPVHGGELPADTVLNRVDIVRALLAAIEALERVSARAQRRALLPQSVGKPWHEDEEGQLREEFAHGEPVPSIATKHGRTIRAIEARLERLGLLQLGSPTDPGTPPAKDLADKEEL